MVVNDDGSIDLYFGPQSPEGVDERNYIKTVEGRDFTTVAHLYGTDVTFFDQTSKPDDVLRTED